MSSFRLRIATVTIGIATIGAATFGSGLAASATQTSATTRPALLTCANAVVAKPRMFVISCADGNSELTNTSWTSWSATRAVGVTTFGLNLCVPYCAASKISYFAHSTVTLSAPEKTKRGKLFSYLVVSYTVHGAKKTFSMSWKGTSGYAS